MKRWIIISVAALVAVWLIAMTVRDVSDAVRHFSSRPHDLLYVVAIAILGGFATLVFTRLSPRTQRHVRVFAWGAAASSLTLFICHLVFRLASLSSLVIDSEGTDRVLVTLFLFMAIVAYLWFEFYRAWKKGVSP